jgi:hypothetical protein
MAHVVQSTLLVFIGGVALSVFITGDHLVEPFASGLITLPILATCAAAVLGIGRVFDEETFRRLSRTHRILAGSRSPVVWIYTVALAAGALVAGKMLGDGRSASGAATGAGMALSWVIACSSVMALSGLLTTAVHKTWTGRQSREVRRSSVANTPAAVTHFADSPLGLDDADLLERGPVVDLLVETIVEFKDSSPGYISLEGKWGSGKSTVVVRARQKLEDRGLITAIFGALHFATTENLAEGLVSAVAAAFNSRFTTIDPARILADYYAAFAPAIEKTLPLGLPRLPVSRVSAKQKLAALLRDVPRPIVVFLEDIDRLRGEEILTLVGATQLLSPIEGFVFVPVMDPIRVEEQLAHAIPTPSEYIRKFVNATVVVPPPTEDTLLESIDKAIDAVIAARGGEIRRPEGIQVTERTWLALMPTLRHVKQYANALSANLVQLRGEVNTFDLLLLTLLEEFQPEILNEFDSNRSLWLTGLSVAEQLSEALTIGDKKPIEERRQVRLAELVPDAVRRRDVESIVDSLLPAHVSKSMLLRDQRIAHREYFLRYRERRVGRTSVSDQAVAALLDRVNSASETTSEAVLVDAILGSPSKRALLGRLTAHAEEFSSGTRAIAIAACASISDELERDRSGWSPNEREEALALIFELLELGRADPKWQRSAIETAVKTSTSLGFARDLVGRLTSERNALLSNKDAIDVDRLHSLLAKVIQERLERGHDPFDREPELGTWVLGSLGDRSLASRWAAKLNRIDFVLRATLTDPSDDTTAALNWERLAKYYDEAELRRHLPRDRDLTELEGALATHGTAG